MWMLASKWASGGKKSSSFDSYVVVCLLVGLQRQKVKFFWFLYGCWPPSGSPAAKSHFFSIFRLLLNAFWHAGKRDLVESFPDHRSDLKKVHYTSSYGQNTPKKETWSQCRILLFWAHFFFGNAFNGSPGFRLRPPSSFGKIAGK